MSAGLSNELLNRAVVADALLETARGVNETILVETSAEQSSRLLSLIDVVKPDGRFWVRVTAAISGAKSTGGR